MAEETMKDFEKEIEESLKNRKKYEDPDAGKWDLFAKMKDEKQVVEVKITEVVNGGCVTELEGERAFIPASQLSTSYVEDLNSYLNKRLEVIVITADEEKNRLVLSHREIERAKEREKKAEAMAAVREGDVYTGVVENIKDYGAFVKLNDDVTGLLHISQISHNRVKNPAAALKVGEEIKVKVIGIKEGKISLSKKALEKAVGEITNEEPTERFDYKESGEAATNLGALLKGLKL
jgi:hypothetical protein